MTVRTNRFTKWAIKNSLLDELICWDLYYLIESGLMNIITHTVMAIYYYIVITGYKWDFTFYKWGFLSTYNWYCITRALTVEEKPFSTN